MSDVAALKCWPSCGRALDWSPEVIIALASHDKVELLFPNIETQDSDSEIPQWRHFPLQVPWFTKEELPPLDAAPLQIYSVGEEISGSHVTAIAWSPPGLAKHRRCALATLTANLVLSIWASEGAPQDESSWSRTLILNDALEDYYSSVETAEEESSISDDPAEKWRLRRRARSFTWAPALPTETPIVGTSIGWFQHMIAFANEDNHVFILAVNSPTSSLFANDVWSSQVLGHFSPTQNPETIFEPETFDEMMDQDRYMTNLAWSPWTVKEYGTMSVFAYATNKDVRARVLYYTEGTVSFGPEVIYPGLELRYAGPMIWSPYIREGVLSLALFTMSEAVVLEISLKDASLLKKHTFPLGRTWDNISGVVWDTHDKGSVRLHFSFQTQTTRHPTAVLEVSPTGLKDISKTEWPYWREQIMGSQSLFSAANELSGFTNSKVWGLAKSPLGEYAAAAYTHHPTDMLEYGVPSERRCMAAITPMWEAPGDVEFPAKAVSAEGIFFTGRRWIEKNVECAEDLPPVMKDMHEKLVKVYTPAKYSPIPTSFFEKEKNITALVVAFKQNAFLDPNTLTDRFEILVSRICAPSESNELQRTLIAFRITKQVLSLPVSLSENDTQSRLIRETANEVMRHIERILSGEDDDIDAEGEEIDAEGEDIDAEGEDIDAEGEYELDNDFDATRSTSTPMTSTSTAVHIPTAAPSPSHKSPSALASATATKYQEECIFCDAPILFTDLTSAVCETGHSFQRCGLSFRAIQEPRAAKRCGICFSSFATEEFVFGEYIEKPEADNADEEEKEEEQEQEEQEYAVVEGNVRADEDDQEDADADAADKDEKHTPTPQTQPHPQPDDPRTTSPTPEPAQTEQPEPDGQETLSASQTSTPKKPTPKPAHKVLVNTYTIPPTLASILYLACDACLYCGGKFSG